MKEDEDELDIRLQSDFLIGEEMSKKVRGLVQRKAPAEPCVFLPSVLLDRNRRFMAERDDGGRQNVFNNSTSEGAINRLWR